MSKIEGSQASAAELDFCRRDFVPSDQMAWETWLGIKCLMESCSCGKMMMAYFERRDHRDSRTPGG